jgi:4-amino-4-deoxy-L-arabinose transferase-like glycosyltransferase
LRYSKDFWIGLTLFVVAFAVRFLLARQLVFPPLDDPAFYIQTARNLAAGRGLVIDVIWTQLVPFAAVTHPSHEFWMPLTTVVIALCMRVFGDTLFAAQLPDVLAGSLLPVLTYALGQAIWKDQRRWSVLAALLVIPAATLVYQSASSDGSALYAALVTAALIIAANAIERRSIKRSIVAGVLCGLSYLTRSHGSLLPIAIGLCGVILLRRDRAIMLNLLVAGALGYVIVVGPWWLRDLSVFGTLQPISFGPIVAARDYADLFNYTHLPNFSDMLTTDLAANLWLRLNAIWQTLGVIVLLTFPFGLIGLPIAALQRETVFRLFTVYHALLWLAFSFLFPAAATTGSFFHSAGAFAPFAAIGCMLAIQKLRARSNGLTRSLGRPIGAAIYIGCLALIAVQSTVAWPNAIALSQADGGKFRAAASWLHENVPADQTIMTTQAHSLNYASNYPAISLPKNEAVSSVRQMADRYGVRYIVITEQVGLYPEALNEAGVRLAADVSGALIYDLRP